jgi:prepilin-type N-terminal cleavage/methylation domain-containing protein
MKSHLPAALRRSRHCGFTLLELLVVMVIIGILAALTLGAFRFAQESAARNRTLTAHAAIITALEQYREKHGEYPEPSTPDEEDKFAGNTFRIGGAHMLYQAITADGNSAIVLGSAPPGGVSESDGRVSDDEAEDAISSSSLPKSVLYPPNAPVGTTRPRFLVDGWNRPFQYVKADPTVPVTVNPTYDLWSFGPLTGPGSAAASTPSVEVRRDPQATSSWVKNW